MADRTVDDYRKTYEEMLGFVPPRVAARMEQLSQANPALLLAQEEYRHQVVYPAPDVMDQKTVQLILFSVLAAQVRDAAKLHGLAALRAGASWDELHAALNLAALFGGFSVINRGAKVLEEVADLYQSQSHESQDAPRNGAE
ncbi:carboxymuconolactone decarboxylase family protein [Streptomyces sp. NPDC058247]|uniref:carboxymuconolactone decarboxylase family protein n=1 Tax=Streptomyces sp. NPDC058247 TaxID=3346401 RepID=UPI0036EBC1B6